MQETYTSWSLTCERYPHLPVMDNTLRFEMGGRGHMHKDPELGLDMVCTAIVRGVAR